ncbi:MAG: hypothetical protein U5N86_00725 [Planctomycetota bacterium]|nr:hypothetical protein [Planctomycetota bacterium]
MRKKFAERSPALNALYLKRAAFLVALFLSVLLGACNGQSDRNPRFEKDYVSAYDLTHRFNLAVYPDLVTGAFHFTGQAAISCLSTARGVR